MGTKHVNSVTFQNSNANNQVINNISYVEGSFYITDNGEHDAPTVTESNGIWTVSINCERNGGTTTAQKFNQVTTAGGNYHEYAPDGGHTGIPSSLNFFLQLELTINIGAVSSNGQYTYKPKVWIAQGHYSVPVSTNNWWIGANNIINKNGNPLFLMLDCHQIGNSGNYMPLVEFFATISGNTSSFTLEKV